jgi:formate hydrogenlyase transcriptional activator
MGMQSAENGREPAPQINGPVSRYEALIRLAEAIRSHPDEQDLFRTLVNELHEVVEFDALSQLDGAANWMQWEFAEPYNDKLLARRVEAVPKEETIAWWVYQNQEPVVVRRTDREARFPLMLERLAKLGLNSACVLPLSSAHRRLGTLAFASRLEDAYSPDEQRFLSLVANQIAVAIDDARAQQRLKLLLDLTNRVVSKLELRELLHEITVSIRHMMQCDGVGVALPDAESGELRLYILDFPGHDEIIESGAVSETTVHVFRTGQVINLTKEQLAADPKLAAVGLNSLCGLPLLSRGRVLGVLGLGSSREGAFLEDDVSFLGQVANQIAIAVENAFAYGEVSQLKDRLAQENVYLESEIRNELLFEDIVGNSQTCSVS